MSAYTLTGLVAFICAFVCLVNAWFGLRRASRLLTQARRHLFEARALHKATRELLDEAS